MQHWKRNSSRIAIVTQFHTWSTTYTLNLPIIYVWVCSGQITISKWNTVATTQTNMSSILDDCLLLSTSLLVTYEYKLYSAAIHATNKQHKSSETHCYGNNGHKKGWKAGKQCFMQTTMDGMFIAHTHTIVLSRTRTTHPHSTHSDLNRCCLVFRFQSLSRHHQPVTSHQSPVTSHKSLVTSHQSSVTINQ